MRERFRMVLVYSRDKHALTYRSLLQQLRAILGFHGFEGTGLTMRPMRRPALLPIKRITIHSFLLAPSAEGDSLVSVQHV